MNQTDFLKDAPSEIKRMFEQFLELKENLQEGYAMHFKRSLPIGEMLSNRWERAKSLKFGEGASIYDDVLVFGDVRVGKSTWIGPFGILDGSGGLTIGSNCSISAGVQIYSHNTVKWAVSGGLAPYEYASTSIGDNCFIGPMSIVQNGVSIGDRVVVAANSFVNRDVPPFTIVGGSPAKIIGRVEILPDNKVNLLFNQESPH